MHFLPDIYVPCDVCKGKRYNRETLEVKYKDKTISDVLDMTVEEACVFFANIPKIARKLQTLQEVGLGYIQLGQAATTLSGGEAQRVKLANELARRDTGQTVYILDEPTTGLHVADVHRLVKVLDKLVDAAIRSSSLSTISTSSNAPTISSTSAPRAQRRRHHRRHRHPGGGRAEPALLHGAVSPARAGARRGAAITEITQTALLREGRLLLQRTFLPDIGVCITGVLWYNTLI